MKVGVIGAGIMGEKHIKAYKNLLASCDLIGIFDNNKERGREIANKYHVRLFKSLKKLLESVDMVSVVVPTEYHYEVGLACIEHNVHMLMEKPITSTVTEAKILVEKAERSGIKIQVGHIEVYNPLISKLKEILKKEQIISIDIQRLHPYNSRNAKVDVIHDLMIHDIYILESLLKDNIINFYALGKNIDNTIKHAVCIFKFKNGIIAQLTSSFKSDDRTREIRIITEKGVLKADLLDKKITRIQSQKYGMRQEMHQFTTWLDTPYNDPLQAQILDFITCIKNNSIPSVTGEDGIKALNMCTKIQEFIKNHS